MTGRQRFQEEYQLRILHIMKEDWTKFQLEKIFPALMPIKIIVSCQIGTILILQTNMICEEKRQDSHIFLSSDFLSNDSTSSAVEAMNNALLVDQPKRMIDRYEDLRQTVPINRSPSSSIQLSRSFINTYFLEEEQFLQIYSQIYSNVMKYKVKILLIWACISFASLFLCQE